MKSIALLVGFFCGNNYEEVEGALTFIQSETIVVNDKVVKDRIISLRQGAKPWTWELLVVDSDQDGITLEIHN
jgi:hypothetical protein